MNNKNVDVHKQSSSIRVNLDPEVKEKINDYLKMNGLKKGWWIRQAILEKLERDTKDNTIQFKRGG